MQKSVNGLLEVADGFKVVEVVPSSSFVGGGTLPDQTFDTWAVRLSHEDVEDVARLIEDGRTGHDGTGAEECGLARCTNCGAF